MLPKLFFIISILSSFIFTPSYSQCLHHQKTLLLHLKNELIFNSSLSTKLVQWNGRDPECCNWYGVECDASGNVVSLQLDHESISGGFGDSSSLFRLEYLQKLNLANNDFNGPPIPKGIQNLTYLTHLNLSDAAFVGQIPAEMLSLKRLVSLDISSMWVYKDVVSLFHPNLEMLVQNLTELRELYLDLVVISYDEKRKWSHIISSYLPNITTLSLVDCYLSGLLANSFWELHSLSILRLDNTDLSTTALDLFTNFSSLTTLSLSRCSLNGSLPNTIFQMPALQNLDLSFNRKLSGSIPPLTQTGSVKSLVLKQTNLSGSIPSSISNLKALSHIDLYYCKFTGSVPSTLANLTQLTHVDLSYNFFTGSLSPVLFEGLSNLVYLDLMLNSFTGNIPPSLLGLPLLLKVQLSSNKVTGKVEEFPIVNVSNIVFLDLGNNSLEGPIPHSLFQLHSLEYLRLSDNFFSGTFHVT